MDVIEGIVGFLEIGGIGVIGYYWKKIGKKRQMIIDKDNQIQDLKNKIQLLELKLELKNESI